NACAVNTEVGPIVNVPPAPRPVAPVIVGRAAPSGSIKKTRIGSLILWLPTSVKVKLVLLLSNTGSLPVAPSADTWNAVGSQIVLPDASVVQLVACAYACAVRAINPAARRYLFMVLLSFVNHYL